MQSKVSSSPIRLPSPLPVRQANRSVDKTEDHYDDESQAPHELCLDGPGFGGALLKDHIVLLPV